VGNVRILPFVVLLRHFRSSSVGEARAESTSFSCLPNRNTEVYSYAKVAAILGLSALASGCVTAPPQNTDNLCAIFREKSEWYEDAKSSEEKWKSPIPIMMSFMYQESSFNEKAKPPRKKILWIIPRARPSSAFGYSQATNDTWSAYISSTGNRGADRNDFDDAIDFIGWYNDQSYRQNRIPRTDTYSLYLAYHEGQGGYARKSYARKQWLTGVARSVSNRASRYTQQLSTCRSDFERRWWRLF
jgi:hypothetical protein